MMPQSGRQLMPRCQVTGRRPENNRYPAMPLTTMPATVVPTAAPAVPKRGRGPRPVMNATLHAMFRAVRRTPRRSGVLLTALNIACNEAFITGLGRSEEHTSELQSRLHLVCRLLL